MPELKQYPRHYVAADFDPADWGQIEPTFTELLGREIHSTDELEQLLLDASELESVIDEYGSRRYIDKSCHTNDEGIKQKFLHFVEEIDPKLKPLHFELQKKFLASPHRAGLVGERYEILTRNWQADVDLFRPENVPLETKITKLVTEYDEISGAMTVDFRGEERTLPQMGKFQDETDRDTRREAWETSAARRLRDRERIEEIYEALLPIRQTIAENAGFDNYRDYCFKNYHRFDYGPEECRQFAAAVEKTVVPLMRKLDAERIEALKIDALKPWDLSVDVKGRDPLRPFDEADIDGFVSKTRDIFAAMDPELAEDFDVMKRRNNLDLGSRRNKQPGGYQSTLSEIREPFIFMNAAGLQRDVETLLHEGGHAFHALAARDEPLTFLRHAPMEFCEVASMSMELLALPHLDVFYENNPAGADRARRHQLEGMSLLAWIATIDQFQDWIYTHPGHTRDERNGEWLNLLKRFYHDLDWAGHEDAREAMWQRQLHLFHAPFYYIEYGIAQLGALQIYVRSKADQHAALAGYRRALKLGGTKPLPALFEAAGIKFDFSEKTIAPLMDEVQKDLAKLPE